MKRQQTPCIVARVDQFMQRYRTTGDPVLVGFSGGPDSMALTDILFHLNIPMELAHFDHGWRVESKKQAEQLQQWANGRKIPFHTERAAERVCDEKQARCQRIAFFTALCEQRKYAAVVLAHHAQDQEETILKRVFEGAQLHHIRAMQPQSRWGPLTIWRPFLSTEKEEILGYLGRQELTYIVDATNDDRRFLRARMRGDLFPYLRETFGKNIGSSLRRISDYADELTAHLEESETKDPPHRYEGPLGSMIFLREGASRLLQRYRLSQFLEEKGITISHLTMNQLLAEIGTPDPKAHRVGSDTLVIDRYRAFLLSGIDTTYPHHTPMTDPQRAIEKGAPCWYRIGSTHQKDISPTKPRWLSAWEGNIYFSIDQSLDVGKVELAFLPPGHSLKKKWSQEQVPLMLRRYTPVLMERGEIVAEPFLPISRGSVTILVEILKMS